MTKPIIDPEFAALIPPLQEGELELLHASLDAEGCREALIVWQGVLLDGHNRLAYCEEHEIAYETRDIELEDRDAARLWIAENQLGRRNLHAYTKASLCLVVEAIYAKRAADNLAAQPRDASGHFSRLGPESHAVGSSASMAALSAGISRRTLKRVKVINSAPPEYVTGEVKANLEAGEGSIGATAAIVLAAPSLIAARLREQGKPPAQVDLDTAALVRQLVLKTSAGGELGVVRNKADVERVVRREIGGGKVDGVWPWTAKGEHFEEKEPKPKRDPDYAARVSRMLNLLRQAVDIFAEVKDDLSHEDAEAVADLRDMLYEAGEAVRGYKLAGYDKAVAMTPARGEGWEDFCVRQQAAVKTALEHGKIEVTGIDGKITTKEVN